MKKYDVAAFVWPSYTGDEERTRIFWERGMGEWQTVMDAKPENNGETWPRKPLWGYVNEADPYVMEMQIEVATRHGVNTFIYDWYWYDKRPFLENCLNDGFLKASNNKKMKFYLMWANHDANTLWDVRNSHNMRTPIWTGAQDRTEFDKISKRLIEKYFILENYYKIDNKPVFMIYDIANLVRGLGGFDGVADAFESLDKLAREYGLGGVHFQYVKINGDFEKIRKEVGAELTENEMLKKLGFSSVTHYQFVHFIDMKNKTYKAAVDEMQKEWLECEKLGITYFPHVSLGWDPNPRFKKYNPDVLIDPKPEYVEAAFRLAKEYADAHPNNAPLIVVNSWNEWTEGSYFEPDDLYGYGYLKAAKSVFAD